MGPQSLIEFGPPHTILGLFGPPKKRVIFGTFNKQQICVFCVFTPNYLSNKLSMLYSCVLFLLFTIACIPTLFWYIYWRKGQRVSQRNIAERNTVQRINNLHRHCWTGKTGVFKISWLLQSISFNRRVCACARSPVFDALFRSITFFPSDLES